MHLMYETCRCHTSEASRLHCERDPKSRHPDHRVFVNINREYPEGRLPSNAELVEDLVKTRTAFSFSNLKIIHAVQFARSNNELSYQKTYTV